MVIGLTASFLIPVISVVAVVTPLVPMDMEFAVVVLPIVLEETVFRPLAVHIP